VNLYKKIYQDLTAKQIKKYKIAGRTIRIRGCLKDRNQTNVTFSSGLIIENINIDTLFQKVAPRFFKKARRFFQKARRFFQK
jgi:hypothetical protein